MDAMDIEDEVDEVDGVDSAGGPAETGFSASDSFTTSILSLSSPLQFREGKSTP